MFNINNRQIAIQFSSDVEVKNDVHNKRLIFGTADNVK